MKKNCSLLILLMIGLSGIAQNPVSWQYSAKKISTTPDDGRVTMYELHFTARIQPPWHIYGKDINEDLGLPTTINFNKNPLLTITDESKEIGDKVTKAEPDLGITITYYNNEVDFVRIVKLKTNTKTNISGSIEFMACTDQRCLPPATIRFNIALD